MANLIKITLDEQVAPKRIMREQAHFLSQLTNNEIQAKVETKLGEGTRSGQFIHTFQIVVPRLYDYGYELFEVSHGADIYPLKVISSDQLDVYECDDFERFSETIAEILNSPHTKHRLEALKCQVDDEIRGDSFDGGATAAPPAASPAPAEPVTQDESPVVEAPEVAAETPAAAVDTPDTPTDEPMEPMESMESMEEDAFAEDVYFGIDSLLPYNEAYVNKVPDGPGAFIVYSSKNTPLCFGFSSESAKGRLLVHLKGSGSADVRAAMKKGDQLQFAFEETTSRHSAEDMFANRLNKMLFRSLLSEIKPADWK